MGLSTFTISWFDFAAVAFILFGITRGRKRGMSEELLDVLKWIGILVAAAFCHFPIAIFMVESSVFSLLSCSIAAYTLIILCGLLFASFIKRQIGDKLIGSDVFGSCEYYFGMAAGGFRYFCILLVFLAFLNARLYTPQEIQARVTYQQTNFGSDIFPTFPSFQQEVFTRSLVGTTTRAFLNPVLIQPTAPEDRALSRAGVVRARESTVNEVLDRR